MEDDDVLPSTSRYRRNANTVVPRDKKPQGARPKCYAYGQSPTGIQQGTMNAKLQPPSGPRAVKAGGPLHVRGPGLQQPKKPVSRSATGLRNTVPRIQQEQQLKGSNNKNNIWKYKPSLPIQQNQEHPQQQNRPNNRHNFQSSRSYFAILQKLANCEDKDIFGEIGTMRQDYFIQMFKTPNIIDKPDIFVLTFKILAKICKSSYDDLKLKFMIQICNELCVMQLRNYLTDLPDVSVKSKNSLYWNNQNEFWQNFITFCDTIINLSPSIALKMYRPLICKVATSCLKELYSKNEFKLTDESTQKLDDLQEKLTQHEKEIMNEKTQEKMNTQVNVGEPPENFRELPIIPDHGHLMRKPYLRPNVLEGGYQDVEHYLDVQFRLLQEDCYGPLRKGILQYLEDPGRGRYDNIRVYKNIRFRGPYVSESKVGVLVSFDNRSNKRFLKINWNTSKRLLYGSLVVLSKDNFKRFIVATVLDRDEKLLYEGLLPISIINNDYDGNLCDNETYTLIESEVYFEPYYHVLKVLQHPSFPHHLAMQDYIVRAQPLTNPPKYLKETTEYEVSNNYGNITNVLQFTVLNDESWPTAKQLALNESQYEAYKLALTHEFTVIQGPPGTGKTYIGTKIAQTLLENVKLSILVVCYTNHALDQFLENILKFTESIARVGNRSKNEAIEKLSLRHWRNAIHGLSSYSLYRTEKLNFFRIVNRMKRLQEKIDSIRNGILSYSSTARHNRDCRSLKLVYPNSEGDVITDWLFEHMPINNLPSDEEVDITNTPYTGVDVDNPQRNRDDDLDDDDLPDNIDDNNWVSIQMSFELGKAHNRQKYLKTLCGKHKESDYKSQLRMELNVLRSRIQFFNEMKNRYSETRGLHVLRGKNVARMSNEERWSTYFSWNNIILDLIQREFDLIYHAEYEQNRKSYEDAQMNWDREVLKHCRVIGMTTTGAARMQKTIKELNPEIVIVEEAAEVLEQHIVSSLTANCKHLILIGDHQQLRPSAAYMKLAKEYDIEVSLFERMIRNKVVNKRLNVQHRMRPEIASLIVPHIYKDLTNHPHVENKPNIRGVLRNVFFLSHNFMEQQMDDGSSRSNQDEADIALGLANYLIQQNYAPEDITILAAYSGQMLYMREQRNSYRHLSNVKITVVDNYQGEESKIIILSLVRNNLDNKIGFLATENRVCVALSRAKEGFFMFGNIDILRKNSELWEQVAITLENMESLGNDMKLKCEIHPTQISTIETAKDFEKVPEGGCLLKCGYILDCEHVCSLTCHAYDRGHNNIPCIEKCERLCELHHVCPKMCKEECGPCKVSVQKRLPCGHDKFVPCHIKADDDSIKCIIAVEVTLPHCGHEMTKPCHMDILKVKCNTKCIYRVQSCGHVCTLTCHVTDDPDHEKYVCQKPCAKSKKGCTAGLQGDRGPHQCPKMCYEPCDQCNVKVTKKRSTCKHSAKVACHVNINQIPCTKKCARKLPCNHFCLMKCHEPCRGCSTKVTKRIPECNHEVKIECGRLPTGSDCNAPCDRRLPCGHRCPAKCREPCEQSACKETSATTFPALCGHQVALPCNIVAQWATFDKQAQEGMLLQHCAEPCNQTLKCDHVCLGTCSQCIQGRIHVPCRQPCNKVNICGHSCEEPCNQVCPPCKKPCEIRCEHSKCNKPCGSPCVPCQEKCSRACPHGACATRCGEACSTSACGEACARALPCGHACRGLCGEPCPAACKLCRPDTFPVDFLGDDFDDDARFIQLQDCPHILEVDDMECLMTADSATIAIRACPFCRKPIINTYRYKDLVNKQLYTDIYLIKQKIFGNPREIKEKEIQIQEIIKKLPKIVLKENKLYHKAAKVGMQLKRNVSLLDLEMKVIYFNILEIVGEYYITYINEKLTTLETEILEQVKVICQSLIGNTNKVSEQLQEDLSGELKRMSSLIQLGQVINHQTYLMTREEPAVKEAFACAKKVILSWHAFDSDLARCSIINLQENLKQSASVVTTIERQMVVKAMGTAAGHWFKCPNNHYFYIDRCGGAMEIGKCIECDEKVGGTNHQLLSTNQHAGEIDGSRHPAWSEQNNLANFGEIRF